MNAPTYSIAITTFVHRFDKYFKPLMNAICAYRPNVDKVVFINGQHKKDFDQDYRREVLRFCSLCPRTYPITSPIVRGCSFMWNTCFNFTNTDYILNINDDVMVGNGFFDDYESMLMETRKNGDESFRINWSFSHFSVYRQDLFDVGYFDERLLGFGEEDGDWLWRWEVSKNRPLKCYTTNKILNFIDMSSTNSENMIKHNEGGGKYSAFNRNLILNEIYEFPSNPDPSRPVYTGLYGRPAQMRVGAEPPSYYPSEKWYRDKIDSV
jgi:hypothetical protein